MEAQGKDNRENIILHNIPESKSEDPVVRKQHDTEVFQRVVSSLMGGNVTVETTQVFRLGKKQESEEHSSAAKQKPRLMMN